jgi:hypothetical protein
MFFWQKRQFFLIARYPGLSTDGIDRFFPEGLSRPGRFTRDCGAVANPGIYARFRDRLANIYRRYFAGAELQEFRLEATPDRSMRTAFDYLLLRHDCRA